MSGSPAVATVALMFSLAGPAAAEPGKAVSYFTQVRPVLEARCGECHNARKMKGGLNMDGFAAFARGGEDGPPFAPGQPGKSLILKMAAGADPEMPPTGERMTAAEIALLEAWIAAGAADDTPAGLRVAEPVVSEGPVDPGHVTVRRLARVEYDNTVRDLLGTELHPAERFPEDGVAYGYDRVGEVLTTSPLHLEEYERAADALIEDLFKRPPCDRARARLLSCDPARGGVTCAQTIVRDFASRAWRRPANDQELAPYFKLLATPRRRGGLDQGLRLGLTAVLLSPSFLFRFEGGATSASATGPARLSAQDVATRLSYFLWSSTPDDELVRAAKHGELATDEGIARQIDRLLADKRVRSFSDDFLGQWLDLRKMSLKAGLREKYPDFREVRDTMIAETRRFFEEFLTSDRPIGELLTAKFTYVDHKLRVLYGLPEMQLTTGIKGLTRVSLEGVPRQGLLTQPSILALTSTSTRTSPSGRGVFVMDRILCEPPPPPPPGIPSLDDSKPKPNETLREVLARHRIEARCRVCHETMDTIGLAFEHYDLVGRYREKDNDLAIDATGDLPGLGKFNGAVELGNLLAKGKRFELCLTKQLLTYATGRGFERPDDGRLIDEVAARARRAGGSLRNLILAIVTSPAFRMRSPEPTLSASVTSPPSR